LRPARQLGLGIRRVEVHVQVRQRINEILADHRFDDESSDPTKAEAIEGLIDEFGWEDVRDCMLDVLRDDHLEAHWRTAAHVFWGAVLDRRELPADELIAWLYHRFDPAGRTEDNDVWSITSKLKGVGYLSQYQPLQDPGVLHYLQAIRGKAERSAAADRPRE
jgi:hypothetical protein